MLQRMAGFGIILKMLPARRAYPAHAGQPMAAAVRGFRSSPYLTEARPQPCQRTSRRPVLPTAGADASGSGHPLDHAQSPRRSPPAAGAVK